MRIDNSPLEQKCVIEQVILLKSTSFTSLQSLIIQILFFPFASIFAHWFLRWNIFLNYKQLSDQESYQATHILVKDSFGSSDIVPIDHSGVFVYKCLRYLIHKHSISLISSDNPIVQDMPDFVAQEIYGPCLISIYIESLSFYIKEEVFHPIFIFQMGAALLWTHQALYIHSLMIVLLTVFNSIISIRTKLKSLRSLKHASLVKTIVSKKIDTSFKNLSSVDLRPGNIFKLKTQKYGQEDSNDLQQSIEFQQSTIELTELKPRRKTSQEQFNNTELFCDCELISGEALVSEQALTGESCPIPKNRQDSLLYQGSSLLHLSEDALFRVKHIGFTTVKGGLIRNILYPQEKNQQIFTDALYIIGMFFMLTLIAGMWMVSQFGDIWGPINSILNVLDLVTTAIPPYLVIAIQLGVHQTIRFIQEQQVICVDKSKILTSGHVTVACFDKTGTITEQNLTLHQIILPQDRFLSFNSMNVQILEKQNSNQESVEKLRFCMAFCHTLSKSNGNLIGDPLDILMFEATQATIDEKQVFFKNTSLQSGEIIFSFPFQSENQSMSVIVKSDDAYYLITKGSPEKIQTFCNISNSTLYEKEIAFQAKQGNRLISICYKQIDETTIQALSYQKTIHIADLQKNMIFQGFLVFQNQVLSSVKPMISDLQKNGIMPCIVSGDHLFTTTKVGHDLQFLYQGVVLDCIHGSLKALHFLDPEDQFKEIDFFTLQNLIQQKQEFAMTGAFFQTLIHQSNTEMTKQLLKQTKVFARMNPIQKQKLVSLLQEQGEIVAFAGDGANDCGALKQADLSVGLSSSEISMAAAFQSESIEGFTTVVRECRAGLERSFAVFKFMAAYSLIQFLTTCLTYARFQQLSNFHYIVQDLIVMCSLVYGMEESMSQKTLQKVTPFRILSFNTLKSIFIKCLVYWMTLHLTITTLDHFALNEDYASSVQNYIQTEYFFCGTEAWALFYSSNFMLIVMALVYLLDPEQLQSVRQNKMLVGIVTGNFLMIILLDRFFQNLSQEKDFKHLDFFVQNNKLLILASICLIGIEKILQYLRKKNNN